jgi:thiamine biosynthesis protein ThiS
MRLKINGEVVEGVSASTVQELLDEMKITAGRVAVEVNLSIVRKADYGQCRLNDGDTVEIVNFVGGGAGSFVRRK